MQLAMFTDVVINYQYIQLYLPFTLPNPTNIITEEHNLSMLPEHSAAYKSLWNVQSKY